MFVDGEPVGRSPLLLHPLVPGRVRVRVLREDPRQFDLSTDETLVAIERADTALVQFDLRPPVVLETLPPGATALVRGSGAGERRIGDTPLPVPPADLPDRLFLFRHACCADTLIAGSALLDVSASRGTALVALRRITPIAVPSERRPPLWRRRWVQWGLVGIGAGLTGAAGLWKGDADRWYDRYLESSDRRLLEGYYDRAVRSDRRSLTALCAGQALFTGGLVLLVGQHSP